MANNGSLRRKLFHTMDRHSELWLASNSIFLREYPGFSFNKDPNISVDLFPLKFGVSSWSYIPDVGPILVGILLGDYGPKQYSRVLKGARYLSKRDKALRSRLTEAEFSRNNRVWLYLSDVLPLRIVVALSHSKEFKLGSNCVFYSDEFRREREAQAEAEAMKGQIRFIRV